MCSEWRLNPCFGSQKKCPFPSVEATVEVKSVATFSVVLVKLATSSLPPQKKLNFEQMGGMTAFSGHNIAGGEWRDDRMNPKKIKKIVISSRVLRNNHLEGLFHTVPNSLIFVLHCRTVPSIEETNTRIILYEHTFFFGTRLLSPLIMGVSLE